MITLYGITNCGTVKAARRWLINHDLEYYFHDFKSQGIDTESLERWATVLGLKKLLNRQGSTWRRIPDALKASDDQLSAALILMRDNPSLIKRPVLHAGQKISVGFDEAEWTERLLK